MSASLIVYGVLAIAVLIALASMFRAYNAPKVEASKAEESHEDTKQVIVHGETREDIVKARLAARSQRRWWKLGQRDPVPELPELDPKPNRPLGG